MKKVATLLLVLLMTGVAGWVSAQPKIVFDKSDLNLGTFKEADGLQTATFDFTNKGTKPLILNAVNASCGCTSPDWTR